ncbi:hypothetical protein Pelo_6328 [Pelomyxa schiedti]|nr:hypothetical protein Pelo_6328 [Pelomyxa schiedti]
MLRSRRSVSEGGSPSDLSTPEPEGESAGSQNSVTPQCSQSSSLSVNNCTRGVVDSTASSSSSPCVDLNNTSGGAVGSRLASDVSSRAAAANSSSPENENSQSSEVGLIPVEEACNSAPSSSTTSGDDAAASAACATNTSPPTPLESPGSPSTSGRRSRSETAELDQANSAAKPDQCASNTTEGIPAVDVNSDPKEEVPISVSTDDTTQKLEQQNDLSCPLQDPMQTEKASQPSSPLPLQRSTSCLTDTPQSAYVQRPPLSRLNSYPPACVATGMGSPETVELLASPASNSNRSFCTPSPMTPTPPPPVGSASLLEYPPPPQDPAANTLPPQSHFDKVRNPHKPIHRRRPAHMDKTKLFCHLCGRKNTPEWRKGPDGPATLCNACGLQWAKKQRLDASPPALNPDYHVPVPLTAASTIGNSPSDHNTRLRLIAEAAAQILAGSPNSAMTQTAPPPPTGDLLPNLQMQLKQEAQLCTSSTSATPDGLPSSTTTNSLPATQIQQPQIQQGQPQIMIQQPQMQMIQPQQMQMIQPQHALQQEQPVLMQQQSQNPGMPQLDIPVSNQPMSTLEAAPQIVAIEPAQLVQMQPVLQGALPPQANAIQYLDPSQISTPQRKHVHRRKSSQLQQLAAAAQEHGGKLTRSKSASGCMERSEKKSKSRKKKREAPEAQATNTVILNPTQCTVPSQSSSLC